MNNVFGSHDECYVSVDVETAGPNPSNYPLLSIGACLVDEPECAFYVELKPIPHVAIAGALEISGLSLKELEREGVFPEEAMRRFDQWMTESVRGGQQAVFVGYNAAFDWMFVCDYFHRYLGRNPFGHAALDLKSLFLGVARVPWAQTSLRLAAERYAVEDPFTHHALADARYQATLFRAMLNEAARGSGVDS